jgi:molybdopterin converting factor subunit 1
MSVHSTMRVKVLFFGRLREVAGRSEQTVELPAGVSLGQLFEICASRRPELARYRSSLVASRNQEFAAWDSPLEPDDEIAFLPPVSGG